MKRTKEWYARLTSWERSMLWHLERADNRYGFRGGGLPDDCSECTNCSTPMLGSGLCNACYNMLEKLLKKANGY